MIQVIDLEKSYGAQNLFRGVNFNIAPKERIGLVGRNGSGKSTLFKIILGTESADAGTINIPKNYRIGSLEQHIKFTKDTVRDECATALPADQQTEVYRAEKVLFGLGFTEADLEKDPLSFSGGYQIRINLTKALLQSPDLLLLDEPTNYLDIVSLRWLKKFLVEFPGEVLLITHDREFMNDVVTHTMGIYRKGLKKLKGGTAKFYEKVREEDEIHEQTRVNQERKLKDMQEFVDKFRAKARRASQAQSRLKQMERMDRIEKLDNEKSLGFSFHYKECPAKVLMSVEDLSFKYSDNGPVLFDGLTFSIGKNDRIGIIGKNGKGKSTLLNVLTGELEKRSGTINSHHLLEAGHFGQTNIQRLHPTNSIEQEISGVNPDLNYQQVRSICGAMLFEGDLAKKDIGVLSGGERSRVLLGKIIARPANILFLDEPTNHLDQESIETLVQKIDDFPGAVVIVTHSEMILKKLANRLIVFHQNKAEVFEGGYDDFLRRIGWEEEGSGTKVEKKKLNKKDLKRMRSEIILERSRELRPVKEEISRLEEQITQDEQMLNKSNRELVKASENGEGSKISQLATEIKLLEADIETNFEILSDLSEKERTITERFDQLLGELDS